MRVVVIGSGSWGTALAQVLFDNKVEVKLYAVNNEEIVDINKYHENSKYFPGVKLPIGLEATNDLNIVIDADVIVISVPSVALASVCESLNKIISKPAVVVNTAKGFHPDTHQRLSEVINSTIDKEKLFGVVSLLGPSHAEEVIIRSLTAVNAVSDNEEASKIVQNIFSNGYLRVYRSNDVIGSEIGVALKNIMAIASGILSGLGLDGDNAKAALMTRGLAEMVRYGLSAGGKLETFLGLTGIGDLIVTCTSKHSRNYQAGYVIGNDNGSENFWRNNSKTVEGVRACKIVYEDAIKNKIEMPIVEEVYNILYLGKKPLDSVENLMNRELKSE
ncbi:MAG: NAD(P)H-dependent glycerol-3-phosphate dehydrogenase [Erysipelotrichaceae bacterium]